MLESGRILSSYFAHTRSPDTLITPVGAHLGFRIEDFPMSPGMQVYQSGLVTNAYKSGLFDDGQVEISLVSFEQSRGVIQPVTIEQQTRTMVGELVEDGEIFAGTTEYFFSYTTENGVLQIRQYMRYAQIPQFINPYITEVSVERTVNSETGDMNYAVLTVGDTQFLDRLGVRYQRNGPVYLFVTPDRILAGTDKTILTDRIDPGKLRTEGVSVVLKNAPDSLQFGIGIMQMANTMVLGKTILPDYLRRLFGEESDWVTHSGFQAGTIPLERLN